jgi:hypothetical protein
MSVTITAVPAVPDAGSAAPGSMTERALQDFVAGLQSSSMSGASQFANPAALASDLLSSLRGYVERAQAIQKANRSMESSAADGDGVPVELASLTDESRTSPHGGPARESLEPADLSGDLSGRTRVSLGEIRRAMDLALASVSFSTETALVSRGASQISHSANTLLRGQ